MWGRSGRDGLKRRRRREKKTEETIREKCKHGIRISDKRAKTFHLPVLNSPSPQSSDCARLPGNQNPVETVSERRGVRERAGEKSTHDRSGRPNRRDRRGCLCLTFLGGTRLAVSFGIKRQDHLHRPAGSHVRTCAAAGTHFY